MSFLLFKSLHIIPKREFAAAKDPSRKLLSETSGGSSCLFVSARMGSRGRRKEPYHEQDQTHRGFRRSRIRWSRACRRTHGWRRDRTPSSSPPPPLEDASSATSAPAPLGNAPATSASATPASAEALLAVKTIVRSARPRTLRLPRAAQTQLAQNGARGLRGAGEVGSQPGADVWKKHKSSYSMLYDGRSRRLAPGYDLVSTVFWPALASAPAMKIGGSDSINSILSGHWQKFAQETGVSLAALRSRIKHLCTDVASQTCASLAIPQECECVLAIVRERAESLKTYLK